MGKWHTAKAMMGRFIMIMPSRSSMILPGETGGALSALPPVPVGRDRLVPRRMMRFGSNPRLGHACSQRWWLFSSLLSHLHTLARPSSQIFSRRDKRLLKKGDRGGERRRPKDGESWILLPPLRNHARAARVSASCPGRACVFIHRYGQHNTHVVSFRADHCALKFMQVGENVPLRALSNAPCEQPDVSPCLLGGQFSNIWSLLSSKQWSWEHGNRMPCRLDLARVEKIIGATSHETITCTLILWFAE
jgi:hypothetical protein